MENTISMLSCSNCTMDMHAVLSKLRILLLIIIFDAYGNGACISVTQLHVLLYIAAAGSCMIRS